MNDYPLNSLRLGSVGFVMKALNSGRLPIWLGSTLRGAFGLSLKKAVCTHPDKKCDQCFLRDTCAYSVLFESLIPSNSQRLKKQDKIPHPMLIRPKQTGGRFSTGQGLSFEIVLIGKSIDYFPTVVDTVQNMARDGLGKHSLEFSLESVHKAGDRTVKYWTSSSDDSALGKLLGIPVTQIPGLPEPGTTVRFRLITPLKLTRAGRLIGEPTFRDMARSILARLSSVLFFHCDTDLEQYIDFKQTLVDANEVRLAGIKTRKTFLRRWSNRQKRFIDIHGIEGELRYKGPMVKELWPYLLAGQHVHMGKNTIMGLGQYEISP